MFECSSDGYGDRCDLVVSGSVRWNTGSPFDYNITTSTLESCLKRVQTDTMTICAEAKINIRMSRNGIRMHLPKANNT